MIRVRESRVVADEAAADFAKRTFYHGTSIDKAEHIFRKGFRVWFSDVDGERYASGGNLGTGIYITSNWRIALWFGPALLRVSLLPGTRVLDASEPADPKIIGYLQREFGREILGRSPWQAVPKNKHLKLPEFIALFRYHYRNTWERDFARGKSGLSRWRRRRNLHWRLLDDFRTLLVRYRFHGYGNPADDNGIVVFAGDRLVLEELIAEVPLRQYNEAWNGFFESFKSLRDLRRVLATPGSERTRRLAEQVRARRESTRR